ncbi:MAG: phage tail protein [Verrucomicrobiota bacterium]
MGASSALAAAVPVLWSATSTSSDGATVTANARGFVAGKYAIELDGVMAGWVESTDGGNAVADVVVEKLGAGAATAKKHLSNVKYEDISITCGTGMSKGFYQWIKASMDGKATRKNGAIHTLNVQNQVNSMRNFYNALISEIGFPALDAASKDAAKMTIKFTPEYTRFKAGAGAAPKPSTVWPWLASRFILEIDGLDCTRVNKIEAIVVKQAFVDNPVGAGRDYQKEPAHLEIPNLVVSLPEAAAGSFQSWFDDFVINGNNGDDVEKSGTLSWMTLDGKLVLGVLEFSHLGIFKLAPDPTQSDGIRRVKAEMYCERMAFDFSAASA